MSNEATEAQRDYLEDLATEIDNFGETSAARVYYKAVQDSKLTRRQASDMIDAAKDELEDLRETNPERTPSAGFL